MRKLKIHAAGFLQRHSERTLIATVHSSEVTCLRCLYWMRLYIPLTRLPQHKASQIDLRCGRTPTIKTATELRKMGLIS